MALDNRWQTEAAGYGACIREHSALEDAATNSAEIIRLVRWIDQSEKELEHLQMEKASGVVRTPDPEPMLIGRLQQQHEELERRRKIYKDSGGPANAPQEVTKIPSPCGDPPARPTIF